MKLHYNFTLVLLAHIEIQQTITNTFGNEGLSVPTITPQHVYR